MSRLTPGFRDDFSLLCEESPPARAGRASGPGTNRTNVLWLLYGGWRGLSRVGGLGAGFNQVGGRGRGRGGGGRNLYQLGGEAGVVAGVRRRAKSGQVLQHNRAKVDIFCCITG